MIEDTITALPRVEKRSQSVRYNPYDMPKAVEDRIEEVLAGNIEVAASLNGYARIGYFDKRIEDEVHDFGDEATGPIAVTIRTLTMSALYQVIDR